MTDKEPDYIEKKIALMNAELYRAAQHVLKNVDNIFANGDLDKNGLIDMSELKKMKNSEQFITGMPVSGYDRKDFISAYCDILIENRKNEGKPLPEEIDLKRLYPGLKEALEPIQKDIDKGRKLIDVDKKIYDNLKPLLEAYKISDVNKDDKLNLEETVHLMELVPQVFNLPPKLAEKSK